MCFKPTECYPAGSTTWWQTLEMTLSGTQVGSPHSLTKQLNEAENAHSAINMQNPWPVNLKPEPEGSGPRPLPTEARSFKLFLLYVIYSSPLTFMKVPSLRSHNLLLS